MILSNPRSQSPAAETSPLSQDIRSFNLQLLDFSSDCVKLIDGSGVVVFLNAGGQRELEVDDCSQIVGKLWLSFWPEPDIALASDALARALAGEPNRFQGRCPTAKGTPKWWDVALTPLPRQEGSGEFVLVVSRDITERKSAEARLQHEYRKLELVYELSVAVNRAAGTQEIYEAAIGALISGIGADRAAVLIADADGVMRFKASSGLSPEYCRAVEGHSPWSPGDREARAFTVPDVKQASALAAFAPALEREGIASLAFVPLVAQDGLIGKFMFYYDQPHVFTDDEVRLAETVATHVAFATERQRREHAIRVSEERFRSLSACFPVGVFTADSAGNCTYSNANARTVCGFDETAAAKAWTAFISPEDRARVSGEWNGAVKAECAFSGEMRFTSKAGTVRWADVHLNPILEAEGRMAGYVGVVEDITDRKNAETEVRRLNGVLSNRVDELMAILDVAPVGLMIATDSTGSEITTNSYLQRLTGLTPGNAAHAPRSPDPVALLSAHGHEVSAEDLPVRKALRTAKDVAPAEYMLRGREGRTFHVLAQARPLLTDDGMVRGAVASYVDITARKKAEQALHESEQRLRMALSAGRMGTWEWDLMTGDVAWSAELERMHGRGEGEFPGTFDAVLEEIHPEDRAAVSGRIRDALHQASDFQVEYRFVRPDGVLRWVEGRGRVLTGSDGAPERMVGVCCDITERKRAAEALRRSEQRLQAILDNSTAFIYLKDRDGKILLVNSQFQRLFGVSVDAIVGLTDYDLVPAECAEALRANDSMVLRAGHALEFEERIPSRD
ncbi:MAG TPA: PAS domain S-box protein, partial [Bryobacteraceae bacterium]|nr:PAS domain S-box protein [Bryobacteraceae bacterium]